MEPLNFHFWNTDKEKRVITAADVNLAEDQVVIGKRVNSKRDGSEWKSFVMSIGDFLGMSSPVTGSKVYRALISQNAPIPTTNRNGMIGIAEIGQIWNIDAVGSNNSAELISLFDVVSGDFVTPGSKIRVKVVPTLFTPIVGPSDISYDGAPYVVSTNSDGEIAPIANTLSGLPIWTYLAPGDFFMTLTGEFPDKSKVARSPVGTNCTNCWAASYYNDADSIGLQTRSGAGAGEDDVLYYELFEIQISA